MSRVLFVDDERAVLDALRARLHPLRTKWEMVFVESGPRAITELEAQSFDVVVSDMRMPGMDGAQLLKVVSERWPHTVRIVLSGYSEQAQVLRIVPVAHQFLAKPCEPQAIESIVQRCLDVEGLLANAALRSLAGRLKRLPALPRTYAALRKALADENVTIKQVAAIVSADAAIAAKVMQMVNSAFFRHMRRTTRIDQAVSYLGFSLIGALVLTIEAFQALKQPEGGMSIESIQSHAQEVAAVAGELAPDAATKDAAMLAGLLHELGFLVLVQELPAEIEKARDLAAREQLSLWEAERRIIGATHAELGAYLLGIWGLPFSVIEAVALQDCSAGMAREQFDVAAVLRLAHEFVAQPQVSGVAPAATVSDESIQRTMQALHAPYSLEEAKRRVASIQENCSGVVP